jgi:hypothetical protein
MRFSRRTTFIATIISPIVLAVTIAMRLHRNAVRSERLDASLPVVSAPATSELEPALEGIATADNADRWRSAASQASPSDASSAASAPPAVLTIRIVAKSSRDPVQGVRVKLYRDEPSIKPAVPVDGSHGSFDEWPLTNDRGLVELEVPSGEEFGFEGADQDRMTSTGYQRVDALAPREERALVVEIPLVDEIRFFGRVLSRSDRTPIAGAVVKPFSAGSNSRLYRRTSAPGPSRPDVTNITDAEGRFEIATAAWREPCLRIDARDFAGTFTAPADGHESVEKELVVLLDPVATLSARVLDSKGAAMSDVVVHLGAERWPLSESEGAMCAPANEPSWDATTDVAGRCTIAGLPPRVELRIELWRSDEEEAFDKHREPLALEPGELRQVEWRIGTGCELTGKVLDQRGRAVGGETLLLLRPGWRGRYVELYDDDAILARTTTDAQGAYRFVAAPSGRLGLAIDRPDRSDKAPNGEAIASFADPVEIPISGVAIVHDVTVYRGLYIRGRVIDPSGAPATRAAIRWWPDERSNGMEDVSPENGEFAIGPLVPGRYPLRARSTTDGASSEEAIATAGDDGLVLSLHRAAVFAGRVIDAHTKKPCAARMLLSPSDGDNESIWRLQASPMVYRFEAGPNGLFSSEQIEAGKYHLSALTEDGRVGVLRGIRSDAGEEAKNLVVEVSRAARVRVRNQCRSRKNGFYLLSDRALVTDGQINGGGERSFAVPVGHVEVRYFVGRPERWLSQELDVSSGEEKRVVLIDGQ